MRKRGSNLSAIGTAVEAALKENAIDKAILPHKAVTLWPELVGGVLAEASTAEVVRGGVLFVRARSSAWANELTFYKTDILQKINARLGGKVISDIHFKAGGRRPQPRKRGEAAAAGPAPSEEDLRALGPGPATKQETVEEHVLRTLARAARAQAWKRANGWLACRHCTSLYAPEWAERHPTGLCPLCALRAGATTRRFL